MPAPEPIIETARLRLRGWTPADREPFARLNADPAVMRHFAAPLTRGESDALADRIEEHHRRHGFTLYAVVLGGDRFIGFIGLFQVSFEAHFTPAVEIGWRLAADCWNRGLATEGARAVARYAFDTLGLAEIVSFTTPANGASRRVMEKIGMRHDPDGDFDHPRLPAGHPLRRHVLHRMGSTAVS
ncbi:MAG: GNAT family N-acetyltransferase [Bryobacteraceae bacterium]